MKKTIYLIIFLIFFSAHSISASTENINSTILNHKIYDFFKKENIFNKDNIKLIIRTPLKKDMYCEKPVFSILNNINKSSTIDLLLTCSKKKYYLTVEVQSIGEYIVANKYIPRGIKIQASDLKILIGRVDQLPNHTYRTKQNVIGKVNVRDIFPLQPITSFMTRPFWLVKVNQQVKIIIQDDNFTISSQAKSLNNGAENETVRVRTNTGKIITGLVNHKGEIIISF